ARTITINDNRMARWAQIVTMNEAIFNIVGRQLSGNYVKRLIGLPNDTIYLTQSPDRVFVNKAYLTQPYVVGDPANLNADFMAIDIGAAPAAYKLAPKAQILLDGQEGTLADLKANTNVVMTLEGGLVTRVQAIGSQMQECYVAALDPAGKSGSFDHHGHT